MGLPPRARRGRAGTSDPGMLAGRVPGPQPRELRRPPAPGRASPGHSPPRRWPPRCAPRPPSPSCPPGSPRAGGGNRRPRPDSASLAAGSSGGGAGRGGKERATRCAGQRSSGQSVTPRGAPAGGGAGGRNPRPEAAGRGRADCLVPAAGRGPAGVGRACHSGRKVGPRAVPAKFPRGPVLAPRGSPSTGVPCPWRRGWAARRRRGWRGFPECAVGVGAFRISAPTQPSLTEGGNGISSRQCRADFLKSHNFLFSFRFSPAFS